MTKLKKAIDKKGLRHDFVAKNIGVINSTMTRYIKGEVKIPALLLKKVAKLLNCNMEDLV